MSDRWLNAKGVQEITGFTRSGIYSMMKHHGFPKPRKVGGKAVRWIEADVREYMEKWTDEAQYTY